MKSLRLAPTPSGYLHSGNAFNFVLTWWQARALNANLILRIDDHDHTRKREAFVEDIFKTLDWLGLDWDVGPSGVDDFEKNFSQTLKSDYYLEELKKLEDQIFVCECSRKEVKEAGGIYPKTCVDLGLSFKRGENSIRLNTDKIQFDEPSFHDCILWRKDDVPAYHLVSLIEDRDQKISHIIRGEDLKSSSMFQLFCARSWGWRFPTHLFHHPLLMDGDQKLSKSQGANSLFEEFKTSEDFYQKKISPIVGVNVNGASDLIKLNQEAIERNVLPFQ